MFEFYKGETDPGKVKKLLSRGRTDLKTLQMLSQWSSETWKFGVPLAPPQKQNPEPGQDITNTIGNTKQTLATPFSLMNVIARMCS